MIGGVSRGFQKIFNKNQQHLGRRCCLFAVEIGSYSEKQKKYCHFFDIQFSSGSVSSFFFTGSVNLQNLRKFVRIGVNRLNSTTGPK